MFTFDEHNYLILSTHESKVDFYSYSRCNPKNYQCLYKFNNVVKINTSYDGNLHDNSIPDYFLQK